MTIMAYVFMLEMESEVLSIPVISWCFLLGGAIWTHPFMRFCFHNNIFATHHIIKFAIAVKGCKGYKKIEFSGKNRVNKKDITLINSVISFLCGRKRRWRNEKMWSRVFWIRVHVLCILPKECRKSYKRLGVFYRFLQKMGIILYGSVTMFWSIDT